jgi:hypothetical protein
MSAHAHEQENKPKRKTMPLTKQRSAEQWAKLIQEVRERSARRRKHIHARLRKQRDKLERKRHREARRALLEKLKRLNQIVRSGRYTE